MKLSRMRLVLGFLSIFFLLPGLGRADQAVLLKMKWAEGRTYQHRNTMATVMTMNLPTMPEPMEMKMNMTADSENAVLEKLDNGGHVVENTLTRMTMDMEGPMSMSYDSSDPAESQNPFSSVGMMIGMKLRMTLDKDNKVVDYQGFEEMLQAIGGDEAGAQTQQMMQGMSPDSMKEMFGNSNLNLPDHPVRVGDSWPLVQKINMAGMEMVTELTYTLTGWERKKGRKCAVLAYVGKGKVDISSMSNIPPGMKMEMKYNEIKGTTWFDNKRGQIVQTNSSMKMSMDMAMAAGDGPAAQGQSVEMSMDMGMEAVFELVRVRKTKKTKR